MRRYDHLPDTGTNKLARLEDIMVTTVTAKPEIPPIFPESIIADIPKDNMIWECPFRHNSAGTPLPPDLGVGKNSSPISVREWLAKYNSATPISDTDLGIEKIAFVSKSEQLFRIEQRGTPEGQRHFLVLPDGYSIPIEKVIELVSNDRGWWS